MEPDPAAPGKRAGAGPTGPATAYGGWPAPRPTGDPAARGIPTRLLFIVAAAVLGVAYLAITASAG